MNDPIERQAAIDMFQNLAYDDWNQGVSTSLADAYSKSAEAIRDLPSAQPEISRIEQELHGKTPEEQYEFLYWLMLEFALTYTDSKHAVIEWLRGDKEDG